MASTSLDDHIVHLDKVIQVTGCPDLNLELKIWDTAVNKLKTNISDIVIAILGWFTES